MFGQEDETTGVAATDNSQPAAVDPTPQAQVAIPEPSMVTPASDASAPTSSNDTPEAELASGGTPDPTPTPAVPNTDDLLDIKQQALQQLSPLVDHLDQSPEDRFRTTMMMIQASDNSSLIKDAYEAAGQITDEKIRAQALLDIVNEINYFTQHQGQ